MDNLETTEKLVASLIDYGYLQLITAKLRCRLKRNNYQNTTT